MTQKQQHQHDAEPFTSYEEFLDYVDTHSETPRALFSLEHTRLVFYLADGFIPEALEEEGLDLITLPAEHIKPVVERARQRLKGDDK